METISINEFQIIAGTGIEDYILLSYNGGQGGKIAVGTFKAQMTPSIKDGKWWIGGESTNIIAEGKDGKTPQFRRGANGIEYAYEGEESWSLLVPYSELKLNFEDLSEEQKAQLKMTLKDLSAEDIALLQKPATDMIAVLESTNTQMQAAKEDAQDTADHPTYIGTDHYVYKWNKNTKEYDKTGIYVRGEQGIQGEKGEQGDRGLQGIQGEQGEKGEQGIQGEKGEQGDRGLQGIQGEQGEKGEQGFTPVFHIGAVGTLPPGENVQAGLVQMGTDETGNPIYHLSLGIPKGEKGENGDGSGNVLVDASGVVKGKQYVFTPSQNGSAEGSLVELVQADTSGLATKEELEDGLKEKQATISDLETIRENAEKGKDALESLGNKSDKIEVVSHGTSDTTFTLTPNVLHRWGEVTSLTLSLEEYTGEDIVYYMAEFVSGSTATTLSVPDNIKWESDVTIEAGKTYQISILNNCGVIGGF